MFKTIQISLLSCSLAILSSCGVEDLIEKGAEEDDVGKAMLYSQQEHYQTEFLYKRFDVFSNQQHYDDFLETVPSVISPPTYDDDVEIMTAFTANEASCLSYARLDSVTEFDKVVVINLEHVMIPNPETCNPSIPKDPPEMKMYFVTLEKTDKAIQLVPFVSAESD